MKKIFVWMAILCLGFVFNAQAGEIRAEDLNLTQEQNQKLLELKDNLRAEVEPIWEEVESGRRRITEIEKRYFEEFWNMLSDEQKQKFTELNK